MLLSSTADFKTFKIKHLSGNNIRVSNSSDPDLPGLDPNCLQWLSKGDKSVNSWNIDIEKAAIS